MKKKPKRVKSLSAHLAAIGNRSKDLRKADAHQLVAARCLIDAGQMLMGNTYNSLDSTQAFSQVRTAIAVARVQLAVADRLHGEQAARFLRSIMKGRAA